MSLITRRRVIAAKIEATSGTAETLAAGEANFNAFDPSFVPEIETAQRNAQASLSKLKPVAGSRAGRGSLNCEFLGTEPNWAGVLLPACGFANSGTGAFTLSSASANRKTVTIGDYIDGVRYQLAGAAGNLQIEGVVGQRVMGMFNFSGIWSRSATALLSPTLPSGVPPILANATLTIGATVYQLSRIGINLNNQVTLRPDANAASGIKSAVIVDRDVRVTVDPEASAGKDWFADWYGTPATAALSLVLTVGSNTCTIAAPSLAVMDDQPGDRDGIHTEGLEFQATQNSAGDDELTITWATSG